MKLEGWKAIEAEMNRRKAREQWADAEAYEAEMAKAMEPLTLRYDNRQRKRLRNGQEQRNA